MQDTNHHGACFRSLEYGSRWRHVPSEHINSWICPFVIFENLARVGELFILWASFHVCKSLNHSGLIWLSGHGNMGWSLSENNTRTILNYNWQARSESTSTIHLSTLFPMGFQNIWVFCVNDGLSCVFSLTQSHGKARNLALPCRLSLFSVRSASALLPCFLPSFLPSLRGGLFRIVKSTKVNSAPRLALSLSLSAALFKRAFVKWKSMELDK